MYVFGGGGDVDGAAHKPERLGALDQRDLTKRYFLLFLATDKAKMKWQERDEHSSGNAWTQRCSRRQTEEMCRNESKRLSIKFE
jgi:hypothetical protein